jgi:hypothetical protein
MDRRGVHAMAPGKHGVAGDRHQAVAPEELIHRDTGDPLAFQPRVFEAFEPATMRPDIAEGLRPEWFNDD